MTLILQLFLHPELKDKFKDTDFKFVETGVDHGSVTVFIIMLNLN